MSLLVALLSLVQFAYGFSDSTRLNYDFKLSLDGFIPLFGGQEGKVDVNMLIAVEGMAKQERNLRAASEIKQVKISFNEAPLPLGLENVQEFFPRTKITFTETGKILQSDAPNSKLPVRLPGLDIKRFPDISYLPIEFPEAGIEVGKSWKFVKKFSESEMTYNCVATEIGNTLIWVDFEINQKYQTFEDDAKAMVGSENEAAAKVDTVLIGKGKAIFERNKGVLQSLQMKADSISTVTEIKTKRNSERKLKMQLQVGLK